LIYEGNINLINSCDAILANIFPFRGPSVDVGTAFEIGYGLAKGLVVVCYTSQKNLYKDRVIPDELLIEDFGMIDNLMIHCSARKIFSNSSKAIKYLSELLSGEILDV